MRGSQRKKRYLVVCGLLAALSVMHGSGESRGDAASEGDPVQLDSIAKLWPLQELLKSPQVFGADHYAAQQVDGVRALLFESIPYRGQPPKVFAYYGVPKGTPPSGGWPAIVIAHGGGGTAYAEYVKMWNSRGYAAIAMDLYGKVPALGVHPTERQAINEGFPDPYGAPAKEPTEEWSYHVVSAIILAQSLLRSFPEINPEKIGLVGTSWGGIHSCIAAGVDSRFKVVVAIYGCGFLSEGDESISFHRKFKKGMPWWDPSHFLPKARMPFFWIAGTNDADFSPDMRQRSIDLTPGTVASSLVVGLGHSDEGQAYPPVADMVDSILRKGVTFPQLERPQIDGAQVQIKYGAKRPIKRADICFTIGSEDRAKRVWQTVPAQVEGDVISAELPKEATAFFFNVYEKPGNVAPTGNAWPISSDYVERL